MSRGICSIAVGAITATVLAACGGGGGGSDAQQIRAAITTFTSKRTCAVLDTKARQALTGESSLAACNHALSLNAPPGKYSITSVTVSGSSGSAHIHGASLDRTVAMVKQGGSWLIDDISQGSSPSTTQRATSPTTPTPSTTPTAPAGGSSGASAAKAQYVAALRGVEAGARTFGARATPDIQAHNLTASRADTAQYRTSVFNFDKQVRAITFPAAAQTDVQSLLSDDATLIGDLDSAAAASNFSEYARLIKRVDQDSSRIARDFQAVARGVG